MNIHSERIYPTFQSREEVDAAINKLLGTGGFRLSIWKSKPALEADLRELIDKKYELLDIIKANNKLRADIGLEPTVYKVDDNLPTLRQLACVDTFTPKSIAELDFDEKCRLFDYGNTIVLISNSIEKCRNHLEEFLNIIRAPDDKFVVNYNRDLKNTTELKQYYNRFLKNDKPIDSSSSTISTIIYDSYMPKDLATNSRNIVLLDSNNDFSAIGNFMGSRQATYILDNPEETFSTSVANEIYKLVENNFYTRQIYKDYCYNNLLVIKKTTSRQLIWKNYIYRFKYTMPFAPKPSTMLSINKLKEYIGKVSGDYSKYGYNNYNDIGNYNDLLEEYTQVYSKQQQLVKKLYGVKPVEELENSCIKTLNNLVYQEQTRIVPRVIIGNSYMKPDLDGFSDNLYCPVEPPECCKKCYNSIYKCDCKCNVCGDANNLCYCLNSRVRNIHKSRPDLAVEAKPLEDNKLNPISTSTIVSVNYPNEHEQRKYIVGYTSSAVSDSYRNTLMDLVSCLYEIDDMEKIKVASYSKSPDATTYKAIVKTYFSKQLSAVSSSADFISNKLDMLLDHYKFLQENSIDTIQLAIEPKKTVENNTNNSSDAKCDGNHVSNGLKFNETHETYMTYCRSCHKSFTVNKPKAEPKFQYYKDNLEVDTSGFTNLSMSAILDLANKAERENNSQFHCLTGITTNSFSINRFMSSSSSSSSSKPNTVEVTSYISVETYNIDIVYSLSEKKALVLVNKHSDIVKDICEGFPEFSYICGKNNVSTTEKCEIEDKIHMVNFGSPDLVKNSLEELGQQQISEAEKIKGYINTNYTINDDVANRINATTLMETIAKGLGITIDANKHGFTKRIAEYMDQLGCKKKRYSDGIYYYGLVRKN